MNKRVGHPLIVPFSCYKHVSEGNSPPLRKGQQPAGDAEGRKARTIVDRRCPVSEQTPEEELFNVLSHGTGFLMACLGLLHIWENYGSDAPIFQFLTLVIYAVAWVVLYITSTLYHASQHLGRKSYLRVLDHCAIFIVIAASYGPYVLHAVGNNLGYTLWGLSWLIAIGGCIFKFRSEYRYHVQSTWAYIVQGWMVALTLPNLIAGMSSMAFAWLLIGGIFLTGGTYFYIRDDVKYNHGAWHMCVVIGSVGFYLSILEILPK